MPESAQKRGSKPNGSFEKPDYLLWGISILVIIVTVIVRVRLLKIPFERDEGEYLYTARLILSGIPPYLEAYDLKMPGLHLLYAFFISLFGSSVEGVHTGLLLVNGLSVICMFFIGRHFYGISGGAVSAVAFAVLSLSQRVYGFSANAEPLLLLPALCGLLALVRGVESERVSLFFLSGVFFGISFTVKQTGMFFIAFALLYILRCEYIKKRSWRGFGLTRPPLIFVAGALLPFILLSLVLIVTGAFGAFLFWTFQYAYYYSSMTPLSLGVASLKSALVWVAPPVILFWLVAGLYLLFLVTVKRKDTFFQLGLFIFSLLSVSAGLYFREHYFILLIPSISLLFAGGTVYLSRLWKKRYSSDAAFPVGILSLAALYMFYSENGYLFSYTPDEISRITYNVNPFTESKQIAEYIKRNSRPEDRLAILGSEPQIFFYSDRLSATKHIVMYPLMNPNALRMQMELIRDIERSSPEILLFVKVPGSWGLKDESEKLVFSWANKYVAKNYIKSGVVEVRPPAPSLFYWDEDVLDLKHDILYGVYIFRRR